MGVKMSNDQCLECQRFLDELKKRDQRIAELEQQLRTQTALTQYTEDEVRDMLRGGQ